MLANNVLIEKAAKDKISEETLKKRLDVLSSASELVKKLPFHEVPRKLISFHKNRWTLGVENTQNTNSFLLISKENCPVCIKMSLTLNQAQVAAKERNLGPLYVYIYRTNALDFKFAFQQKQLGITGYPALFVVDKQGRLIPWSSFLPPDESDPNGAIRTTVDKLLAILK